MPPIPPIDFVATLEHRDPNWIRFDRRYDPVSMIKPLSCIIFALERQSIKDKSIKQSWIAWSNPRERWTTDKIPIACDLFIPPLENFYPDSPRNQPALVEMAMNMAKNGPRQAPLVWSGARWYTTVNMTIDVKRALPEAGVKWLFQRMKTSDITDGEPSPRDNHV